MYKKFLTTITLAIVTNLFTTNSIANSFEVSAGLLRFDYREFDTTGDLLNKESGFIPGIGFKYSLNYKKTKITAFTSIHDDQIDYTGQTQSGQPHNTRTNEILIKSGILLTSRKYPDFPARLLFSVAFQFWDRDILNNNNVHGLHERYTWYEYSLGLNFKQETNTSSYYWANTSALLIYQPEILVYLKSGNETLNIGEKIGLRLQAGKTWIMSNKNTLSLSLTSEFFELARSNTIYVNNFFGEAAFLTEPDSKSFHNTIDISYTFNF